MIYLTASIVFLTIYTDAFHHPFVRPSLQKYNTAICKFSTTALCSSEDDDWYADYDPSKFEMNFDDDDGFDDNRSMNRRSSGRERSGRRGGYTRDTSRDLSNVDENAVADLLNQRTEAKKTGDYDTADAIREKLLNEYSVGVNDRERTWRTGCSTSGSGQRFGGGGARGRGEGRRDRYGKTRKPRDFGPRGHDYNLSEGAGANISQLSEDEIHNLLAERLQAKMSRNFQLADSYQMELIDAGVFVHDGMKEWRADGVPYGSFQNGRGPGRTAGSRSDRTSSYTKSPYSADVVGASESVIDALVQERLNFKLSRDFDKADAVREGLRTKFNVLIDDRLKEWSVGGDFGEEHNKQRELADIFANRGYIKSSTSLSLPPEDEKHIQDQVDERCQAKKDRDFTKADEIRAQLEESYDVSINDKLKLWSVGGAFEELGGSNQKARGVYKRRGGGEISDEDVLFVEGMLKKRYHAKRLRDFDVADAIRDELMDRFGVKIDDRSSEWRVESDDYALMGTHNLSTEDVSYIESKLKERYSFKRDRYYDEADSIRNELDEKFRVVIDDRTKEWRVGEVSANMNYDFVKTHDDLEEADRFIQTVAETDDVTVDSELNENDGKVIGGGDDDFDEKENNAAALSKLTVPQLKEKLKESGLPVSGKKAELIERLLAV